MRNRHKDYCPNCRKVTEHLLIPPSHKKCKLCGHKERRLNALNLISGKHIPSKHERREGLKKEFMEHLI